MSSGRKSVLVLVVAGAMLPAARGVALSPDTAGCGVEGKVMVLVRRDTVSGSTWARVVDCEHRERPARMVLLADGTAVANEVKAAGEVRTVRVEVVAPMLVQAGETVRLWSQDGMSRMETTGVAQESGGAGKRIRVRLLRQGMNSVEAEKFLTGVVDGPGSVEMGR